MKVWDFGSIMNFSSSLWRHKRFALLFSLFLVAAWLVFTLYRTRRLLANGRHIAHFSELFARDYDVGRPDLPSLTYLVLGDSTAAGWGAEDLARTYPYQVAHALAARGTHVHVVVRAVAGARLSDVLVGQLPAIPSVRPDIVTLSIGANDATHFTSKADYERELQILVAALEKSGARQILVADTPNMFRVPALPLPLAIAINLRARAQNRALAAALRGTKIRRVELYERGQLNYRRDPTLYAADLFHPSGAGYGVWAPLFVEKLEAMEHRTSQSNVAGR